jgi:CubicO group peptidase (beta-lactamase class C family)
VASTSSPIALDDLARELVVDAGVARAAALGVGVWSSEGWKVEVGACGHTGVAAVDEHTVFDLASISKSFLATTYARLEERDLVPPGPLAAHLTELSATWAAESSLESLLSHRSGLAAHATLFAPLECRRPFVRARALRVAANAAQRADSRAGESFPALYSDLGYLLAGAAISRSRALPLDALVAAEVSRPLGLTVRSALQWQRAQEDFGLRVAPTENVPFRGGELRGVVHDENAWALAGHGFAGHAGLFGTVRDVLAFGMALLDGLSGRHSQWLRPATLAELVRERAGGSLRLGFDGKSAERSAAGVSASALTFGHLGFTGTSFWCDPMADAVTVLLTNRVCPTRENNAIRGCRPVVHDALFRRAASLRPPDLNVRDAAKGLGGSDQP